MIIAYNKTIMESLRDKIETLEREEINKALAECNWVMARAARMLGITERMIGYKIKKYGLRKEGDNLTEKTSRSL